MRLSPIRSPLTPILTLACAMLTMSVHEQRAPTRLVRSAAAEYSSVSTQPSSSAAAPP